MVALLEGDFHVVARIAIREHKLALVNQLLQHVLDRGEGETVFVFQLFLQVDRADPLIRSSPNSLQDSLSCLLVSIHD